MKLIRNILIASTFLVVPLTSTGANAPAEAQVLQGNVTKSGTVMRLSRPSKSRLSTAYNKMPPKAPPIRISRKAAFKPNLAFNRPAFDVSTFKNHLAGQTSKSSLRSGTAKTDRFFADNKFDLGSERNIRELRVAWEKWHKQLSKAIYDTWSAVADEPGKTTLKVIVRSNRSISIVMVDSKASNRFNRQLKRAIMSLEGNPGLSFPTKSRRKMVSFEADYIAARNVRPGYSWVKDDFETIREHY